MGIYKSLAGMVCVQWTGADVAAALEQIGKADIPLFSMQPVDEVTVRFSVYRRDLQRLNKLAGRRGDRVEMVTRVGIYWLFRAILSRPVFLIGMAFLFLLGIYLPGRILFVSVEGNQVVPGRMILEAARENGVCFGASRREIRSEQVKNGLLETVPQLQWAGVNTYGCRAVITVRERFESRNDEQKNSVCHVIASRDGIITSCTVTQGSGVCFVGQAVRRGDVLISGYTDCGITITAQRADGEIFAETQRHLTAVMPSNRQIQSAIGRSNSKYSLIIGKKRINFYKGSGISGGSCDKMYSKYVLTLPGGFTLPVALVKETVTDCELIEVPVDDGTRPLEDFSAEYLNTQMIAGKVVLKSETVDEMDGIYRLDGIYACIESIGMTQEETIGEFNGKTNGTDRQRGPGG